MKDDDHRVQTVTSPEDTLLGEIKDFGEQLSGHTLPTGREAESRHV